MAEFIAEDYRKHSDLNVITLRPRGFIPLLLHFRMGYAIAKRGNSGSTASVSEAASTNRIFTNGFATHAEMYIMAVEAPHYTRFVHNMPEWPNPQEPA